MTGGQVINQRPGESCGAEGRSTVFDTDFSRWYQRCFKKDESDTVDHVDSSLPTVEEFDKLLSVTEVSEKQSVDGWLEYMTIAHTLPTGFLGGCGCKGRMICDHITIVC